MPGRLGAYKPTEYHAADGALLRSILPTPAPLAARLAQLRQLRAAGA
jgi:hypothetical protein